MEAINQEEGLGEVIDWVKGLIEKIDARMGYPAVRGHLRE